MKLKRVALIVPIIVIMVTAFGVIDITYFEQHNVGYGFISNEQLASISDEHFNYSVFRETIYFGIVNSEELDFYINPINTSIFLSFTIEKFNTSTQAELAYFNYSSILNFNVSASGQNESYLGFSYSYIHPQSGYPLQTFVLGKDKTFILLIALNFTLSNVNLEKLIHSQINAMF